MKNSKFIIYNKTKSFKDFEIFAHITNLLSKGLLSNKETEYCYASTWNYEKCILCIETGIIYDSAKDVETKLNINRSHISDWYRGKRNKTGGYSWRFVNE